jgi:hypothetical protein
MGKVHQCRWKICQEIKAFSRFEYHIFYIHLSPIYWLSLIF